MSPAFLRPAKDGLLLSIRVQPRASQDAIAESLGEELKIRIAAPPVDDAANEALTRFLAQRLGCPRGHIRLVRGRTSRHKVVSIRGLAAAAVLARLQPGN